jgi:hypothetical protein
VARAWGRRSIGVEYSHRNAKEAWDRIVNVGMIRKGASRGRSTAIFAPRSSTVTAAGPAPGGS